MSTVSFIIAAHNRREVLLRTLWQLQHCGLRRECFEILVVDNASTDGTADAVNTHFPDVNLIRSTANYGACAKNLALPRSSGRYIVFLDDDSYPTGDSVRQMVARFESTPTLGAASFNVILPDGSRECSAYPNVFIGCGAAFRREALAEVGGLPDDFFMQAEEYDLSLRLLNAGWSVKTFNDLHVSHLKAPGARISTRTTRLDVRNNLMLIFRRFPEQWVTPFARDWTRRYGMIARVKDHRNAHWAGLAQGMARALDYDKRKPISLKAFEDFTRITEIRDKLDDMRRQSGIKRVLLADLGKNVLSFALAAERLGIQAVAVADNRLGRRGFSYRGVPIVDDGAAITKTFDAVIVSNVSPVHASDRAATWRRICPDRPVIDLFEQETRAALAPPPVTETRPKYTYLNTWPRRAAA